MAKPKTSTKTYVECFIEDDMFAAQGGEHQTFISVNGRSYLVKTGEIILVPPEVKEVVDNRRAAKAVYKKRVKDTFLKTYNPANM